VSVEDRLADLRGLLAEARTMPMSASVMVNRTELLEQLESLERAVRDALADARDVAAARDQVVAGGQREAEGLVAAAHDERERMASETEVLRSARERADEEVDEARRAAQALREEADAYVDHKLAGFEVALERTLDTVRRGRQRLAARGAPGTRIADPDADAANGPGDETGQSDTTDSGFW